MMDFETNKTSQDLSSIELGISLLDMFNMLKEGVDRLLTDAGKDRKIKMADE